MKKTLRILLAALTVLALCVGLAACGHKEHTPTGDWLFDDTHHWHACEKDKCENAGDKAEHTYDSACDTSCNVCGATRKITHVYDQEVASSEYLKQAATESTRAQYYKSCVCGAASTTEFFETDKTTATLTDIEDLSKIYDKVALANPTFTTNSDATPVFEWYQAETKLDSAPINAGTYTVKVILPETETYTGISQEKEFTIGKKVLSGLVAELTYNGEASFELPLGTNEGILEADVADGITIGISFDSANVGATVTTVELDAASGDSYANYEVDLTTSTASIVKRSIWASDVVFVYDSYAERSGEEAKNTPVFQNVVSGESIDYSFVTWTFESGNAKATLTSVEFMDDNDGRSNYEIDFSKCTATIEPRTISVDLDFKYNGLGVYQKFLTTAESSEILSDDTLTLDVFFDGEDVGSLVSADTGIDNENYFFDLEACSLEIVPKPVTLKSGEALDFTREYRASSSYTVSLETSKLDGYCGTSTMMTVTVKAPSKNADNYTSGVIVEPYTWHADLDESKNYDFSAITTATLKITPIELNIFVTVEYNGTTEYSLDNYRLTPENTGYTGVNYQDKICSSNDVVYLDWFEIDSPKITSETFAIDYLLSGEDSVNYKVSELGVEVVKKKLTNLDLKTTSSVYEGGTITLFAKDGIVLDETVQITISNENIQDLENGTYELLLNAPLTQGQEIIALVESGDYANYELVANENGLVGYLNIVECDIGAVNYNGICTCCGTDHYLYWNTITGTLQRPISPTGGWIGEVYKLESGHKGYWDISVNHGTYQICTFVGVYDAYGNEVPFKETYDGISFYVEQGTYYAHVEKIADYTSNKTFVFNFARTLEDDGTCAESEVISGAQNKTYYFYVEADASWGGELRIYSDDGTTLLDEGAYTLAILDERFNTKSFTYEYPDISGPNDTSLVGTAFYIAVTLNTETTFQVELI